MKTIKLIIFIALVGAVGFAYALPPNDYFVNRETITGNSGSAAGSNMGATLEDGEPNYSNSNTVWWSWTPTTSGSYAIDTFGSTFDTYLAVFTGNSVSSLLYVAANNNADSTVQSLVCLEISAGVTYQIQVSGYHAGDDGFITLNWKPAPWGDWIYDRDTTNTYFYTFFANDLSVLSFRKVLIQEKYFRTNEVGCMQWKNDSSYFRPDGLTIYNKNNEKVVDGKQLDGGSTQTYDNVMDYNGKSVLTYNYINKTLTLYAVKKGDFTKTGEQIIEHFTRTWFSGTEIYAELFDKPAGVSSQGLKVFDKKLNKEKWNEPLEPGLIRLFDNGLVVRNIFDSNTDTSTITYRKKGKKIFSKHILTMPSGTWYQIQYDPKGGLLYWIINYSTNSPLSYLDRKGRKVVDNEKMTDVGDEWSLEFFDGKSLYVKKKVAADTFTFFLYKLKGMKKIEEKTVTVPNNGTAWLKAGKMIYIYSRYSDPDWYTGVDIYDKKLKKVKWTVPYAKGELTRLVKDIFIRKTSVTIGDITTLTYKIFGKKGEIVTYVFSYTK